MNTLLDDSKSNEIVNLLDEVIFELDKNRNFTYLNQKAELFWNKSSKELLGKNIWKEFPFIRNSELGKNIENGVQNEIIKKDTIEFSETNKKYFIQVSPSSKGTLIFLKEVSNTITSTNNSTAPKKIEEEINYSQHFLQSVIDGCLSAICVLKSIRDENNLIADFEYILVNKKGIEIGGNIELVGKKYAETYPGIKKTDVFNKLVNVVTENIPVNYEINYTHDGFNNWYHVSVVKFNDGLIVSTHDVTKKKTAQLELLKTKDELTQYTSDKYKALFNSTEEGIAIMEVLFENKKPVDLKYIEINSAFERHSNLSNPIGKTFKEIFQTSEQSWIEEYAEVVLTGESKRFEVNSSTLNKWIDIYVSKVGNNKNNNQVAVIFNDITIRKQKEIQTKFLSELTYELLRLNNEKEIISFIGKKLSAHLNISSLWFLEIDDKNDLGTYANNWSEGIQNPLPINDRISEFISKEIKDCYRSGNIVVVKDTHSDPRIFEKALENRNVRSSVGIPFLENNEWKYILLIHDKNPRDWKPNEIELMQELSNRLFPIIKRARAEEALRISEKKNSFLIQLNDELRNNSEPLIIQLAACKLLGEYLNVDRAYYYEYDSKLEQGTIHQDYVRTGSTSLAGTYRMKDFPGAHHILHKGQLIFEDASTTPLLTELEQKLLPSQLNIVSLINIPLIKDDKLIGVLGVCDSQIRNWTELEISLVQGTAERTWAVMEKAIAQEALRKSEERHALLLKLSDILRPINDINKILEDTCQLIGDYLNVNRVSFADIEYNNFVVRYDYIKGITSSINKVPIPSFGKYVEECYQNGENINIIDILNDIRFTESERIAFKSFEIEAVAAAMLLEKQRTVAAFGVTSKIPRNWNSHELELLTEVGNRLWTSIQYCRTEEALRKAEENYRSKLEIEVNKQTTELKESKELLQRIINAPNIGLAVYNTIRDEKGNIENFIHEFVNERTQQTVGKDPTGWLLTDHGKEGIEQLPGFIQVMQSGESNSYTRHVKNEGFEAWYLFFNAKLDDNRLVHVWEEITELKKAELKLHESKVELEAKNELLESIFETSVQSIMVAEKIRNEKGEVIDYRFKLQNDKGKELLKVDVTGKLLSEVLPFKNQLMHINNLLEKNQLVDYEHYFENENNKDWFRITAAKLGDGMAIGFDNITNRKQQEIELKETHEKLKAIFERGQMQLGYYTAIRDDNGNIIDFFIDSANSASDQQLYSNKKLSNNRLSEILVGLHEHPIWKRMVKTTITGEPQRFEEYMDFPIIQGWYDFSYIKFGDGIISQSLNITDKKNAEEEVIQLKLNQQKEIIKAVLNSQEEERKNIAESLHNGLGQLLYSIRMRLDSFNIESTLKEQKILKVEVDSFLEQAIDITRNISLLLTPQLLETFGLKKAIQSMINKLINDNLWINLKYECKSTTDSSLEIAIFRMVQELLNNIVKHSQASIASINISINETKVRIEVKDNGKGMKKNMNSKATGMGLKMIENRVHLMNGKITIESNQDKGTKIAIDIQR